ncbi:tumor necrosis factor receptor superfamily member 5 [Betta splendens]|uniref:Tumor necrosis factor receptor superfamily member 5 n=1 Tax=Betta splendens TaxID=158456 RepID=A0A6P7KQK6_BETSP|nr:tumor necrosis factor receptor superfamily member 5 [Betta splendens]
MTDEKNRCGLCPAGQYLVRLCNGTAPNECATCKPGQYTATENGLKSCQICDDCRSDKNLQIVKNCAAAHNTVCGCTDGFYCGNVKCDHCQPVRSCSAGEGVRVKATRTSDTVCEPCRAGTYSNVTDWSSACRPHVRCEDTGKELKTAGTSTADAVCRDRHPKVGPCGWELPAGLWAGLVVTAILLLAVVIYRKAKRGARRAGSTSHPVTLVKPLDLTLPATSLDLSLPDPKEICCCQESCAEFKQPLTQDEELVSCSIDSSLPITPLKASVSFAEATYTNKGTGYCPGHFLRTPSEPQEDEWCGT